MVWSGDNDGVYNLFGHTTRESQRRYHSRYSCLSPCTWRNVLPRELLQVQCRELACGFVLPVMSLVDITDG